MSDSRRRKPPNRAGCKPTEDVCVQHDSPRICQHGCVEATEHKCAELDRYKDQARKIVAEAARTVLRHCDVDSDGETDFERSVIRLRESIRRLDELEGKS